MDTTAELCAHCEYEVTLPAQLGVFKCPNCEMRIVTCSMCEPKNECLRCKHAHEAHARNR